MDSSPLCLDSLTGSGLQIEAVLASESLMEDLRNVGMGGLDVFIALSEDDNKNALAAQIASHIFHVPNVICRIGDPAREKFYRELGMNVIAPTVLAADTIKRALEEIH
jgi:trk system potassium uptake protein TrkA